MTRTNLLKAEIYCRFGEIMPKSVKTTYDLTVLDEVYESLRVSGLADQLNAVMAKQGLLKQYKYKRWNEKRVSKIRNALCEAFKLDDSYIEFPDGMKRFQLSLTSEETLRKIGGCHVLRK